MRSPLFLAEDPELEDSIVVVAHCELVTSEVLLDLLHLDVVSTVFFFKVLYAIVNSIHFDLKTLI